MQKHTKIYFNHFGYDISDFVPCETCGSKAVDIHHIDARGMGGSDKNDINNLMALCRECHVKYGDIKEKKEWLNKIHQSNL
jgi:5-methylcytosine-specific restriction endonuclease McrA